MNLRELFPLLRDSAKAFSADKAPRLAAAFAYYTIFALAPLLFMVIVIAGLILGEAQVKEALLGLIPDNVGAGQDASERQFIENLVEKVNIQQGSTLATVLGAGTLFFGATGLFANLQVSLNSLWGADPPPVNGVWNIVRTRLVAFALVVLVALLVLAYLIGNTVLAAFATTLGETIGLGAIFARLASIALGVGLFSVVFAMIYQYLPDVDLTWREVWTGAIITAILFTLGQVLIGLYFARVSPGSVFGAAGSLVVLLLWIYYSSMILFFGAEITWVYSQRHGQQSGGIRNPDKKAAVASKGGEVPTGVSAKEREAARKTAGKGDAPSPAGTPHTGASGASAGELTPTGGMNDARRPRSPVPGLGQAVLNVLYAVLALPALTLFGAARVARRVRRRKKSTNRTT